MNKIVIIAKKEWQNLLLNPTGYIFAGILLVVCNWLFFGDLFLAGQADIKPFWGVMSFLFSIFIPAMAMGMIADEKKNGTWEVILASPLTEVDLVVGKFLGGCMYLFMVLCLTLPTLLTLLFLGKPDIGLLIGGYVGIYILAVSYLSISIFFSSLGNQGIVAFLLSTIVLIINNLLGQDAVSSKMPYFLKDFVTNVSLGYRSSMFSSGLIEINSIVFFVSWIVIFVILTVMSLKTRDK